MISYDSKMFFEDPFFKKQPSFSFKQDLEKAVYATKPSHFGKRDKAQNEVYINGAVLCASDFDQNACLETVFADFKGFIRLFLGSDEDGFKFTMHQTDYESEHFRLEIDETECKIFAGDSEGIRRALYFIEDEIIRLDGPFLPRGTTEQKPFIKNRITRNFFTPHQANAELKSEEDYYPDGYLSRLAHEGINGLWIFVLLREFVPSKIVPEYGTNGEALLKKLNQITKKCARYGIKVFALGVEPYSTYQNKILSEKHPDMLGEAFWGGTERAICPCTEKGSAYIEECMYNLFTLVPGLAGFIGITLGEAVAGCGSVPTQIENLCPHCKEKGFSRAMALAQTERLLKKGMKRANKNAEFISWTYAVRNWSKDMQYELCTVRDNTIPLMANFEDKSVCVQLGKERVALDYWLSVTGPGETFENFANHPAKPPLYAKTQVCSSHELATVPYVPVPGILYDRYKEMRRRGVEGVMYCWFFGNYPSLMNQAASQLAFHPFPEKKQAFLLKLASLYVDKESAPQLAKAWAFFEEGYKNCPCNIAFSWFGPINDAIARPYHLLPKDVALPSNWILSESVEGDRFGEFCGMVHTPEETVILLDRMLENWQTGLDILESIAPPQEMLSVAKTILLLIRSAKNMMQFYIFRNRLGYTEDDALRLLSEMEKLCKEEIANSLAVAKLCEKDTRLGFHSEAVGFKFFPEKLLWRAKRLKTLLETEFCEVRERIAAGKAPLAFFTGENAYVYDTKKSSADTFVFADNTQDKDTKISVRETDKSFVLEIFANHEDAFKIDAEFRMFLPYVPLTLNPDATLSPENGPGYFIIKKNVSAELEKWKISRDAKTYKIVIDKETFGIEKGKAFRIAVRRCGKKTSYWKLPGKVFTRLMYGEISPDEKVFIL